MLDEATLAGGQVSLTGMLAAATAALDQAGVDSPRLDARLLLGHALGLGAGQLIGAKSERRLTDAERGRVVALLARRLDRQPIGQILGQREFWSLPFVVTPAVLSPRPDSETLVAAVLDSGVVGPGAQVLDLGTGSGCLLLAVLSASPGASGIGVDISAPAVAVARRNARALGLAERTAFAVADWADGIAARFDVVLCNPPYVRSDAIAGLMPEVARHEPHGALDGGPDGLCAYRRVLPHVAQLVKCGGIAALEIGGGLAVDVGRIAWDCGLTVIECRRDLAGVERCILLGQTKAGTG